MQESKKEGGGGGGGVNGRDIITAGQAQVIATECSMGVNPADSLSLP